METSHLIAQATGTNTYVTSSTTTVIDSGIPGWIWVTILVIILIAFLIWLSSQSKTK